MESKFIFKKDTMTKHLFYHLLKLELCSFISEN